MESTNQESQMLSEVLHRKNLQSVSHIVLLTHNAAGYYGSELRAHISVKVVVRESLHTP